MIANASQVRIPCESPVPSRPVPSHKYSSMCPSNWSARGRFRMDGFIR